VIDLVRRVLVRVRPSPEVTPLFGTVPVGQEPELQPPPGGFNEPPAVSEPLPIHEEIFHKARIACANYCARNDLSSADLLELLEMLGLDDGEAFSAGWRSLTYSGNGPERPRYTPSG
jgi:hypothetical protein